MEPYTPTKQEDCGCRWEVVFVAPENSMNKAGIIFCPLHAAAGKLKTMVERLLMHEDEDRNGLNWMNLRKEANELVTAAEGKS